MREETRIHLAYLDGWRGLAILLVLLGHFWTDPIRPGLGVFGVGVFFVLSGRLMAEILFVRRSPLPTFFWRRFSRVYPALFVFVVLTTILFWPTRYGHGIAAMLVTLTFTSNYAMTYVHPIALLDHLWSLCVEEHGYLLLAATAGLLRRAIPAGAAAIAGLALAAFLSFAVQTMVLHAPHAAIAWRTDVQVAPLFLAAAMHLAVVRWRIDAPSWAAPATLAGAFAASLWGPGWAAFWLPAMLLAISVVTVDRAARPMRRLLESAALRRIGLWSFSLYLWQQPFYKLSRDYPDMTPLLVTGAVAAGILSFHLVERPSRTFLNHIGPRLHAAGRRAVGAAHGTTPCGRDAAPR